MSLKLIVIVSLLIIAICGVSYVVYMRYLQQWHDVARIEYDAQKDRADFVLGPLNEVNHYFAVGTSYSSVPELRKNLLRPLLPNHSSVNGYVTIRFVVNKYGDTDRYRIQQFDTLYQATCFPQAIADSLVTRTKKLKKWIPGKSNDALYDSYFYIVFKIRKGNLIDIAP